MCEKLLQILYPGVGGQISVAHSIIEGDTKNHFEHQLLGYGIEDNLDFFKQKAQENNVIFTRVVRKKPGFDLKSWFFVYKTIKESKPDYIILHSTALIQIVWLYCKINKIKFLVVEHQSNKHKKFKDWIKSYLISIISPKTVYLTDEYYNQMKKKLSLFFFPQGKIIIRNGINLFKFDYKKNKQGQNISKVIKLTMMSRMNDLRDHYTLIRAVENLIEKVPISLTIAGDGPTKSRMELLVSDLGLQDSVSFKGWINEDQIIELLTETSIYIHSSKAETMSTSILQAMAMKVPIIATNISGVNNLLADYKDAILFELGDVNGLMRAIVELHENLNLRRRLSETAYLKMSKSLTCESMFEQYHQALLF